MAKQHTTGVTTRADNSVLAAVIAALDHYGRLTDRLVTILEQEPSGGNAAAESPAAPARVTKAEQRVLKAVRDGGPLDAADLADALGRELSGSLRELFASMVTHGLLQLTAEGYGPGPNAPR